MKKILLLTLSLLPLVIACNNKSTSLAFENPFPNDHYYENERIGFNLATDEIAVRPLSTTESDAVTNTTATALYNEYITTSHSVRQFRSYARAFAGNYKQGYDASNLMVEETRDAWRQEYSKEEEPIYKKRTISKTVSRNLNDYSYGQIGINQEITSYRYLYDKENKDEAKKYEKIIPPNTGTANLSIHDRIQTIENRSTTVTDVALDPDQPAIGWPDKENLNKITEMQISQSELLSSPTGSDCGADANGLIILVSKNQQPYNPTGESKDEGIYRLADGREYRAVNRSITVAKAKLMKKSKDYANDWVLVQKARTYTETVITSDIIQPNVPITDLKEPIVITFEEVIYDSFGTNPVSSFSDPLPSLPEPEPSL